MNVWIFKAQANYTLVLGTDIEYFQDHFVAKPLADQWKPTHEDPKPRVGQFAISYLG